MLLKIYSSSLIQTKICTTTTIFTVVLQPGDCQEKRLFSPYFILDWQSRLLNHLSLKLFSKNLKNKTQNRNPWLASWKRLYLDKKLWKRQSKKRNLRKHLELLERPLSTWKYFPQQLHKLQATVTRSHWKIMKCSSKISLSLHLISQL